MEPVMVVMLAAGLLLLIAGGEWLVRGSSRLAALIGVSSLVIGLTVAAFGASSPELAVSVEAALSGQADIALGSVVGSSILNVLLVDLAVALGVSQVVIGLTIVSIGTSLPEIATTVIAGLRGERDIAVGNVVGSNLFNMLGFFAAPLTAITMGVVTWRSVRAG